MGFGDLVGRAVGGILTRSQWARVNQPVGDLLVNSPDGFPSGQMPVWWFGSDSGGALMPAQQVGLSAVTRATALIVDPVTSVPWRLVSVDSEGWESESAAPRWVSDPMLLRPDDRFPGSVLPAALRLPGKAFWGQWVRSVLWHGMGFLLFEEATDGQPIPGTMRILNPLAVSPVGAESTGYVHRRIGLAGGPQAETDREGRLHVGRTYRLVELCNPLDEPDDLGMTRGVLQMHAAELGLAGQAVSYASGTYRSGVPSGFLKVSQPNFGKDQADKLKAQWMESHGGDRRSVAVLSAAVDFTPLQMSLEAAQLVESRQMSITDISNMFGVPAYLLNGKTGDSATYSNVESRSVDLRAYTLLPWVTLIEEILSSLMPQGTGVRIDMRGLARADTKTRFETYEIGMRIGMTANEWRRLEGLPRIEGGDSSPALVSAPAPTLATEEDAA